MKKVFLDTNVFVSGLLDDAPDSACRAILEGLATKRLTSCVTAWHCCLEFFSVTTRLPPDYRLSPDDAIALMTEHIFGRVEVADLPVKDAIAWLKAQRHAPVRGGLIYDAHLAAVAAGAGCSFLVTRNLADFRRIAPHGIEILSPEQFVARLSPIS